MRPVRNYILHVHRIGSEAVEIHSCQAFTSVQLEPSIPVKRVTAKFASKTAARLAPRLLIAISKRSDLLPN